jgi:hypothetical protein
MRRRCVLQTGACSLDALLGQSSSGTLFGAVWRGGIVGKMPISNHTLEAHP